MAAAREGKADFTTCPICLQIFKSPKSLPCLHSFCEQCISEYIQRMDKKQEEKVTSYPCPVCRTPTLPTNPEAEVSKWGSLLPENRVLSSSLIGDNEQKSECNPCKRRKKFIKGEFWCRDCQALMCINCKEVHGSLDCSLNHTVYSVENTMVKKYGIDVSIISETCPVHSSKHIEAFCFDHKQLCCVSCLTLDHRKCNDVQTIDKIAETHKEDSFQSNMALPCLQTLIENLTTQKQRQLEQQNDSVESLNTKASKAVACAKDNLDCLLISFKKELTILEDNEKSTIEDELRKLNQIKTETSHLYSSVQFVADEGTLVQQFIYGESVKSQIKNSIMPIIKEINVDENTLLQMELNSTLNETCSLSDIAKLSVVKSRNVGKDFKSAKQDITNIYNCLGPKVTISAKYKKSITLPRKSFSCGTSLTEHLIACGDQNSSYLRSVDIDSGRVICDFNWTNAKRIAFDKKRGYIFETFVDGHFNTFTYKDQFESKGSFQDSLLGGISICDDEVYVIVKDSIRKFSINTTIRNVNEMTLCFQTNTECPNDKLNGLAIDAKTKHIVYTSKNDEVVCTNFKGDEVFRIRNEAIKKPTSVIVHSSAYILVGDEGGSVHAISSDGNQHVIIIEKCHKITKLCDLWLDHSEQTLFLCGNEFIEMYSINL